MKKVVVGLSGGVDSAVACYLLKIQGYEVEAVFMQNWDSFINNEDYDNQKDKCDSQYEWEDAQKVANLIGIKITKVDFIKEYWEYVFKYFINEYRIGHTPNPDILCNKYIKFGCFLDYTIQNMDCDYIATGHYAAVEHNKNTYYLKKSKDENKDQTYFLCALNQKQLSRCLFPLANLTKDEVRKIANQIQLEVWNKKDSTGICFIGERNFKKFMQNYINDDPGKIVDIDTNEILGDHDGVAFFTIGQNNGLNLGGMKQKYYVCKKDVDNKILYVCSEDNKDKHLLSHKAIVKDINWITKPTTNQDLQVRFRHRQELIKCSFEELDNNQILLSYDDGQFAVTEGQFAVLYQDDVCLGGGPIFEIIK